jgi:hypothetical protein
MEKKDISRRALKRHDIRYEKTVYQDPSLSTHSTSRPLPDHVDAVREALLSFEDTIPAAWKRDLRKELTKCDDVATYPEWTQVPPKAAFVRRQHNERILHEASTEHDKAHKNVQRSQQVAKRAKQMFAEAEPEWSHFWRSEVFLLFNVEAKEQSGLQ